MNNVYRIHHIYVIYIMDIDVLEGEAVRSGQRRKQTGKLSVDCPRSLSARRRLRPSVPSFLRSFIVWHNRM